jgi:hypothetical protein
MRFSLRTGLLASSFLLASIPTGFASLKAQEPAAPALTVDQLDPQASLGLKSDARLPAECGGGLLPADLVGRERMLRNCEQDLKARKDVMKAVGELQLEVSKATPAMLPVDPNDAVSALNARPGKRGDGTLNVEDAGEKGVIVDDGRRKAVAPGGADTGEIDEIESLADLTLVAGGCPVGPRPICVAIFAAGTNKFSVQKVGDPIAKNARVVNISGKGSDMSVTVELKPVGGKVQRKEFRL